ncbi:MAG: D-sedoheptulose 7-phosphate isomerase [Gemmatimonadales bacterium]
MDPLALIQAQFEASAEVKRQAGKVLAPVIAKAAEVVTATFKGGGRLLLCGNGGSAADCQHLAAEFVSALNHDAPRAALSAIALTTDTSFLTANANDFGFDHVFERQVEAHGRPGDTLLAISTSGNSKNVLRALERARSQGLKTILLTGEKPSVCSAAAELSIHVPSRETQRIQESHITIGHILCDLVERALFPGLRQG